MPPTPIITTNRSGPVFARDTVGHDQLVEVLRRGAVELLLADVPDLAFRQVARLGRIGKRVVLVRYDPPVVHFAQTDSESQSVLRVAVEVRWRAAPQQGKGERDVCAGRDVERLDLEY